MHTKTRNVELKWVAAGQARIPKDLPLLLVMIWRRYRERSEEMKTGVRKITRCGTCGSTEDVEPKVYEAYEPSWVRSEQW